MKKYGWLGMVGLFIAAVMLIGVSVNGCGQSGSSSTTSLGTVSGVVVNSSGTAVSGATVSSCNGGTVVSAETNSSGVYTLSGVSEGVHVLTISSNSYYAASSVAVTAGSTTTQNITADAGSAATAEPVVTLTSVGTATAFEFFTVAGTVTGGGANHAVISVNNNDSLALISLGAFSKVVHLVSGTNTIVVTAFNSKGYNQKTITVTYTPPTGQSGTVKVTLNWDRSADIDLHLWNQAGTKHTYYNRHYGGPLPSITVEVMTTSGTPTMVNYPKDTSVKALPNTLLDYDNIGGTGPENMTIYSDGLTGEARYLVGVNGYSIYTSTPINCSLSVKLPDGTTKSYTHSIASANSDGGNPNTDTTHWWRPFDIVVSGGVVSIADPDLTTATSPTTTGLGGVGGGLKGEPQAK